MSQCRLYRKADKSTNKLLVNCLLIFVYAIWMEHCYPIEWNMEFSLRLRGVLHIQVFLQIRFSCSRISTKLMHNFSFPREKSVSWRSQRFLLICLSVPTIPTALMHKFSFCSRQTCFLPLTTFPTRTLRFTKYRNSRLKYKKQQIKKKKKRDYSQKLRAWKIQHNLGLETSTVDL